ncbi:hypothetical protein EHI8A_025960 [Entamoeba histolytica HM-1:IMSS-B]|uniref:Uncharacterized protein n=6 Tax=Entamoeba histolytica TaxID=5759 RepID=C4LU30_ENTH1|nr:hypothetical protein EHI_068370 [Entamoeba histolytica HM-1:IMSS]EMD42980.1 Hypothetical protein EHI5A_050890 [Entamoeba histolytica KU27]EMH73780.1 hypothetical protein EHI8A_025960 [Entamoeba histolytica HM-1:IMSS-B]EMS13448.1 hypothetical protein KM1_062740 [Entamoeba histolytica HM-3:IMSS]ENY60873.1 hypothetical protein EHI7A_029320 [Entamoeba histolytica HM-1:IMSS-A]GAT92098.1 hypothetical protein CL6EHI_068370 [Entamoeba histolytica]|eukprot:XP_654148.1 hypothetical protein EHI_068370 [Entamoeba histolytica HM-1:IMSS]
MLVFLFCIEVIGINCQTIPSIPFYLKEKTVGSKCFQTKEFPILVVAKNSNIYYQDSYHSVITIHKDEGYENFSWYHKNDSFLIVQHPTDNSFVIPLSISKTHSSIPLTQFNGLYGTFYKIKQNGVIRIIGVSFIPSDSVRKPATIITFQNYFDIDEIQVGEVVLTINKEATVFVGYNKSESVIGVYIKNETVIGGDSCKNATEMEFPTSIVDYKRNFGKNEVWYKFNGIEGRNITVDTCASESQFDTSIKIFDSCKEELIGSNDNACGTQSKITFLSKNTDYFIVISHGINATDFDGTFRLNIYDNLPLINSRIDQAIPIQPFQVIRTNNILPNDNINQKSVYFTYLPLDSGVLLINSCDKITNVENDFIVYSNKSSTLLSKTDNTNVCGEFGKYLQLHVSSSESIIIEMKTTGDGYVHIEVTFQQDGIGYDVEYLVKWGLTICVIILVVLISHYNCYENKIKYDM